MEGNGSPVFHLQSVVVGVAGVCVGEHKLAAFCEAQEHMAAKGRRGQRVVRG